MPAPTAAHWARLPSRVPVLGYFWKLFTSVRFALILILLLAGGFFLGVVISQAPQEIAADPRAFAAWAETEARPRFGSFTDLLLLLGLFDVFHALWFRALLILLFTAITVCTLNRFPAIYQSTVKAKPRVSEGFLRSAKNRASFVLAGGVDDLVRAFRQRRYHVTVLAAGDRVHVYADKHAWAKYATFASHLGLLLFLFGGMATNVFGYQRFLVVPDGMSQPIYPVFHPEQVQVYSEGFTVEYWPDGRPKDYYTDLVLYQGGQEATRGRIRVNSPLDFDGWRFHQNSFGPTVRVEITSQGGQMLYSETLVLGQAFGNVPFEVIGIPTTEMTAVAALVEGNTTTDIRGGTFIRGGEEARLAVLGFKGEEMSSGPSFTMRLAPGETQEVEGLRITFQGTHFYSGVFARKDPGATFIWIAATLFVPAVWATFWFARRRVWAQVMGNEVRMAGQADRFVDLQKELDEIVQAVARPDDDVPILPPPGPARTPVLAEAGD